MAKRVKITGNGRILKRKPGQGHFNAKDSGSTGLHKHGQKLSVKTKVVKREEELF